MAKKQVNPHGAHHQEPGAPDNAAMSPEDMEVLVHRLWKDAEALFECGDYEASAQALAQAKLYLSDAYLDEDTHREYSKLFRELEMDLEANGVEVSYPYPPDLTPKQTRTLKTKLLK